MYRVTYNGDGHVIEAELCEDEERGDVNDDYVYGILDYDNRDIDPDYDSVYNVEGISNEALSLRGRTLYIGDTNDYGLFTASDAKIFVVQYETDSEGNRDLTVESYTNASAALNSLKNDEDFSGSISAVLSDAGTAEYLVINSDDDIGLVTDDGTSDSDSGDGYTYTATIFPNGLATVNLTAEWPEWIDDDGTLGFTFDISINGDIVDTMNGAITGDGNNATQQTERVIWNSWSNGFYGELTANDEITVENFEFTLTGEDILVRYEDERGNDITSKMTTGTTKTIAWTGQTVNINAPAAKFNAGSYSYVVENATDASGDPIYGTATVDATKGLGTVYPDGDDFVVITLSDLTDVATTYQVSSNDADSLLDGTGMTISNFKDENGNANTAINTLRMVLTGAAFETPTSAQPNVNFSIWVGGVTLPNALAYEVTVNIAGRDYTAVLDSTNNSSANAVSLVTLRLDQNIVIDIEDVTVTPIMKPSLENAIWNGSDNSLTLVFSDPIRATTATVANLGAGSLTLNPDKDIEVSGQNVTLYLLNKPADSSTTTIAPTVALLNTDGEPFDAAKEVTLAVDANGVVTATVVDA